MKHFLSIIAALTVSTFATFADTPIQPQRPVQEERVVPITLTRVRNPSKGNRIPSIPIYGYYDGETLTIDFVAAADNEILTVYFHCDNADYSGVYTAAELRQGVIVTVNAPFRLEVVTESGAVYTEYCDSYE